MNVLAVTGGVGGAKLCLGLTHVLDPIEVQFLVNVGDDFEHMGLSISPDIDTLLYTLADVVNTETGWGRANESWSNIETLAELGGEPWFRLGDRDLALHLIRSQKLRSGSSLTQVTNYLARQLNVDYRILPATDNPLKTLVETERGVLAFQEYFVKEKCAPIVTHLHYDEAVNARLNPELDTEKIQGVIICPSNPFLSVDPILAIPEFTQLLKNRSFPVLAVSPIVASQAIKGPTAKIMKELNLPVSSSEIAKHYDGLIDGYVIDSVDEEQASVVQELGIKCFVTSIWMKSLTDKVKLATECFEFLGELQAN